MKLDIKSFLIGILTTVNLFLLMGFDDHKEEKEVGRFAITSNDDFLYVMDTTNGVIHIPDTVSIKRYNKYIDKNPLSEDKGF